MKALLRALFSFCCLLYAGRVLAQTISIPTPLGTTVDIDVPHAGPSGDLVSPISADTGAFRPPTFFSAPLPSGSGARALGVAGAFTALADDATAASWNPAGLIQLERPECSMMIRYSAERQKHKSEEEDFRVGDDTFGNFTLNYLSAVVPFRFAGRNWVFSMNYQEAYDFTQEFHSDMTSASSQKLASDSAGAYDETVVTSYSDASVDLTVTQQLHTVVDSTLRQVLQQDLVNSLNFEQQGIIDAVTAALAIEVTPKVTFGAAVNFYSDGFLSDEKIKSHIHAEYSGRSTSSGSALTSRTTDGTYTYGGTAHFPGGGGIPPFDVDFSESNPQSITPFTETTDTDLDSSYYVEGTYEEDNEFKNLEGVNATLGAMWDMSRWLKFGVNIDLPWTAEATQTKTIKNHVVTYDSDKTRILDVTDTTTTEEKDVEFSFPLYWAMGTVVRWNMFFYTLMDVNQTLWSDFAFQAEGDQKINPLDGSLYGENKLDDCWSIRLAAEYLKVLPYTEIPVRGGVSWEQRPAIDRPDEYWSISLGSGVSLGKDPGKLIVDMAYVYTWGEDVLGSLVPDQEGLSSDSEEHQVYVSTIYHF